METQEVTYRVRFVAESSDNMGYQNYVFENINYTDEDNRYMMCVRFPNWNQEYFDIGDEGYVTVKYVREGIDKWFDGTNFNVYNYTNVIFLKFIPIKEKITPSNIILD